MAYKDFMNKVHYWDNIAAKWIMRHFYFMFFQITLVVAFFLWFINTLQLIDISSQVDKTQIMERLLLIQAQNADIIVFLLILNSFWLLFIFSFLQRIRVLLKDMNYNLNKMRGRN